MCMVFPNFEVLEVLSSLLDAVIKRHGFIVLPVDHQTLSNHFAYLGLYAIDVDVRICHSMLKI